MPGQVRVEVEREESLSVASDVRRTRDMLSHVRDNPFTTYRLERHYPFLKTGFLRAGVILTSPSLVLLLFVVLLLVPSLSHSAPKDPLKVKLPELPVIDGATSQWIGRRMAIDGLPASLRLFQYNGTVAEVKRFYESFWKIRGHGQTDVAQVGPQVIMGNGLRGFYQSVQMSQVDDTVMGQLMVTLDPLKSDAFKHQRRTTEFPILPGNKIKRVIESVERGRRHENIIMSSERSVVANLEYVKRHFEMEDWRIVPTKALEGRGHNDANRLSMESEQSWLTVMAFPSDKMQGGCTVVVNWMK